jgi:DNA-binding NarL/FixJ family response regulator
MTNSKKYRMIMIGKMKLNLTEKKSGRAKILIIDDNEKHLQPVKEYLEQKGFQVLIENSAEKSLDYIKNIKPDIIILDITMYTMSGYQFVKKFQLIKDCSEIPFLFVTAKGMTQDRIRGYAIGCSGYILKPFDPEELIAIIKNVLERKEKCVVKTKQIRKQLQILNGYIHYKYNLGCIKSLNIDLTKREINVLECIFQGFKNREIASKLNTGIRNIEKYVSRLLDKTKCRNRTELVKFCYCNNLFVRANDGDRTRE